MVDPLSYITFNPVIHNWCNKDHGMCYPVYGMVHIKEPLLLIGNSNYLSAAGFLSRFLNGPLSYLNCRKQFLYSYDRSSKASPQ